jgi:plastocyanin
MKLRGWHLALGILALGAASHTTVHALTARSATVGIHEFKYGPAVITIPVGARVTWVNHDEEPHTVTAAAGTFTSVGLSHEETFTRTFTERGSYEYFCALHPYMKATVVVK